MSPRRRLLAVLATALMLLVAGVVAVRALIGSAEAAQPMPAPAREQPGPVLVLPGYGGSTSALQRLAATLRAVTGRDVRVVGAVGDGTGDLNAQAAALQTTVGGLLADGAPSVDVVGYSAGGVVARLWAADRGGA
ncbi:MAG: esterase/lipase family protein, partial [Kineosporiaceae bacterium]